MKLKTLTLDELNELQTYFHDCGTSHVSIPGKGNKIVNPYADFLKVQKNPKLLANFLYKKFVEDSRLRSYFDYNQDMANTLIEVYKTNLEIKKQILQSIEVNLINLNLQKETNKINKIIDLGYDSDVSDISFSEYLANKYNQNVVYKEYKTDYKKKFLEESRFNSYNEEDVKKLKQIEAFVNYDFCWKWLMDNSSWNDIEITDEQISSKFSNEKPGYVGRNSGDLIHKKLLTMILKYTKLKFQTETTEYINTNGFW